MDKELFWEKVNKTDTCWFWVHSKSNGYGQFGYRVGGKVIVKKAHRIAWELTNGEIPQDKQVDHMCGLRSCVNPKHLRLVSQADNLLASNYTYKTKAYQSKKAFYLYIHNPRFVEEEKKSALVNKLLDEHYSRKIRAPDVALTQAVIKADKPTKDIGEVINIPNLVRVSELRPDYGVCKKHGTPLTANGKCLQKGH